MTVLFDSHPAQPHAVDATQAPAGAKRDARAKWFHLSALLDAIDTVHGRSRYLLLESLRKPTTVKGQKKVSPLA